MKDFTKYPIGTKFRMMNSEIIREIVSSKLYKTLPTNHLYEADLITEEDMYDIQAPKEYLFDSLYKRMTQ